MRRLMVLVLLLSGVVAAAPCTVRCEAHEPHPTQRGGPAMNTARSAAAPELTEAISARRVALSAPSPCPLCVSVSSA